MVCIINILCLCDNLWVLYISLRGIKRCSRFAQEIRVCVRFNGKKLLSNFTEGIQSFYLLQGGLNPWEMLSSSLEKFDAAILCRQIGF